MEVYYVGLPKPGDLTFLRNLDTISDLKDLPFRYRYRIRGQTFQFAGTAYVKSLILEPAEHADETGKSYVSGMHSTKMNSYASLRETREVRSLMTLS